MSETQSHAQRHPFKAEIQQLLDILVHSVYTSKDVFIRELISNAADALEKVRFQQVSGTQMHSPDAPLEIRIETHNEDDEKRLVITDTGIGMTADEVRTNIGTIAHSGATAFIEQLQQSQKEEKPDLSLIGRFGVGFYSVFMAAKKVVLTSRSAQIDAEPVRWESDGLGSYTLETVDQELPRGTRVEIHLKEEEGRFAENQNVQAAIRRYSNFVSFPIFIDGERVNRTEAVWREPPSQVSDEKYNEFFKLITHDSEDPLLRLHHAADAPFQFSALLFVPQTNYEIMGFGQGEPDLQLYVKRVLIDSQNKDLLPDYLRFVRGVVESEDLPLNVSRETLQENRIVAKIRDSLTKRMLERLAQLAREQPERYTKFWKSFGRILKEGYGDFAHREKLAELLRFNSSVCDDHEGLTSLAEYVQRMPADQKGIYYLSGPSREALVRDPRLELFRRKGIEVLYLYDVADEFVLGSLGDYQDKPLVSADQVQPEDLAAGEQQDISEEEKRQESDQQADIRPLMGRFKEILGDAVVDVRESQRLVDSPACLVGDDGAASGHMEKMMRMINKSTDLPKRVLELNPKHPLIVDLLKLVQADREDPFIERACRQLFEGSMLLDGYLVDPHELIQRMNQVLTDAAATKSQPAES